jgi:hypothetical protein
MHVVEMLERVEWVSMHSKSMHVEIGKHYGTTQAVVIATILSYEQSRDLSQRTVLYGVSCFRVVYQMNGEGQGESQRIKTSGPQVLRRGPSTI